MERRDLLVSLGSMGTVGFAGCLDMVPFLGSETKLGRLAVVNWDQTNAHTIDVKVERDETLVHESSYTVGKMDGNQAQSKIAKCTWDDTPGKYVIVARLAGSENWRRFDLIDIANQSPDCVIARIQYGSPASIPDDRPLNVQVRARCDQVDEHYEGGCPAYISNRTKLPEDP